MLNNLQKPTVYKASSASEIRAIGVPSGALDEVFVFTGTKPLAVLTWVPDSRLDDSEEDGVFKPDVVSSGDPGRWVFSRFITCGVGW